MLPGPKAFRLSSEAAEIADASFLLRAVLHRISGLFLLITLAVSVVLTGCSGSQTVASTVAAVSAPKVAAIINFGASITCGYYATSTGAQGNVYSTQGYAGLFDAHVGAPSQNLCRSGDQAADTVKTWVQPNAQPKLGGNQLFTIMVGTNDANNCGASDGCLANWSSSLKAALAWMALPASDKTLGTAVVTRTGSWKTDLGMGISTTDPGASVSLPFHQVVSGRMLYLAYRVFDASAVSGATATVSVDGHPVSVLNSIVNTGHAISTVNGSTDSIFLASVPLGAAGDHNVTITTGSGGGFFSFLWAGLSTGPYTADSGAPRVMLVGLPISTSASLNAVLSRYTALQPEIVSALAADGISITLVPLDTVLNPASDFVDTLHPNDSGHHKLAAALEAAL
jgi:lysophospholipase L1-like esterase